MSPQEDLGRLAWLDTDTATTVAKVDDVLRERVLVETELTPRPIASGLTASQPYLSEAAPSRLTIRLADTLGHRNDASFLVRKRYGWRGYDISPYHSHPNCVTLVASDDERILATITVGFDSDSGLAAAELYPDEIVGLRIKEARICEFTRLAVDRSEHSKELLAMMFHVAYMYAYRLQHMTDLLIEVNPRHSRFYERMLGFRQIGEPRLCTRVNAPAVLMWLPLHHAEDQIAAYGGRHELATEVRSLYPLFFSPEEEAGIIARLRTSD